MASVCTAPFSLTGSRVSSPRFSGKNFLFPASRLSNSVLVICASESFRGGVAATVRSSGRESVTSGSRVTMAASAEVFATAETAPKPFGVLFVCLGEVHCLSWA